MIEYLNFFFQFFIKTHHSLSARRSAVQMEHSSYKYFQQRALNDINIQQHFKTFFFSKFCTLKICDLYFLNTLQENRVPFRDCQGQNEIFTGSWMSFEVSL